MSMIREAGASDQPSASHCLPLSSCFKMRRFVFVTRDVGMCLKENYSDSPSNEYSRHYSGESEYLRRQNINSKLGEEQKKKRSTRPYRSPNFDSNSDKKQKKRSK